MTPRFFGSRQIQEALMVAFPDRPSSSVSANFVGSPAAGPQLPPPPPFDLREGAFDLGGAFPSFTSSSASPLETSLLGNAGPWAASGAGVASSSAAGQRREALEMSAWCRSWHTFDLNLEHVQASARALQQAPVPEECPEDSRRELASVLAALETAVRLVAATRARAVAGGDAATPFRLPSAREAAD
mmetsp:Transcript_92880/g.261768  ORF Transcript_92880/g.261768 Transcript_92880/m.261768 type:complete len:187 (-) Transcript_92880:66-626(-)